MNGDTVNEVPESSQPPNTADLRQKLRQKWELASVLNFLQVFEPVMKTNLKLSAEHIETGLIEFNDSLVQLHIALLKGITKSKLLDGSEAWASVLGRVLQSWWPWVAQGDFPLSTTKGEELSRYKELDPTVRLLILKSVCEVRATKNDIASFINESTNGDTVLPTFRKEKLADENGTAYWYDGDEIIGHRLYREVHHFENKIKFRGKEAVSDIYSEWETVATNLEEFRLVMDEFASSEFKSEVHVSKILEVDVIPALVKLEKKKQSALKQLEKQKALPCAFLLPRSIRSQRILKLINYTYDEYDRVINEAIKVSQNLKVGSKLSGTQRTVSTEGSSEVLDLLHGSSTESDSDTDGYLGGNDVDENDSDDSSENEEDITDEDEDDDDLDEQNNNISTRGKVGCSIHIPRGSRFSSRLARSAGHGAPKSIAMNTSNRLRQMSSVNTAFECSNLDSEEANLSNSNSKYLVSNSGKKSLSNSSCET